MSSRRVSRVKGSIRTQGGIEANTKRKRKGKDKRIMEIKRVHNIDWMVY